MSQNNEIFTVKIICPFKSQTRRWWSSPLCVSNHTNFPLTYLNASRFENRLRNPSIQGRFRTELRSHQRNSSPAATILAVLYGRFPPSSICSSNRAALSGGDVDEEEEEFLARPERRPLSSCFRASSLPSDSVQLVRNRGFLLKVRIGFVAFYYLFFFFERNEWEIDCAVWKGILNFFCVRLIRWFSIFNCSVWLLRNYSKRFIWT